MKNPSAYLKMRVLGAIDYAEGNSIRDRIKKASEVTYTDEDGHPRKFTWRTISTWLYRYKKDGITAVKKNTRADKGIPRKMPVEELQEAVNRVLPFFREKRYNKTDIYRKCIEQGLVKKEQLAPTTYYRFIREYELLKDDTTANKKRMAFCMQYANELWQADTLYGPHVLNDRKKPAPTKLIAFIDDASRVLVHGEFFFEESTATLTRVWRSALYKRGVPEQLYVDNGAIYASAEITLICARIGCLLRHTPVRDGAAKGKIERFFKTVRESFLLRRLDLSSLEVLNRQFQGWVEDEYNAQKHSALGMSPLDRFAFDLKRIRFLPPGEDTEELFFMEEVRRVKKDNTFSLGGIRWEAPVDLRDKPITVRFDRSKKDKVVVFFKSHRIGEARLLDGIANGKLRNKHLSDGGRP